MSPEDLQYTSDHEWIRIEHGIARIGITDFAQDALGDIVFVTLPTVGTEVSVGDAIGEVESTKSVSDVYAPVAGKVTAVNDNVETAPETMNEDPYGQGWFAEIQLSSEPEGLLSATEYQSLLDAG